MITAALCAMILIASTHLTNEGAPQIARTPHSQTPVWISATAATDADGALRYDLLPRWRIETLEQLRAIERARRANASSHLATGDSDCEFFVGEVPIENDDVPAISDFMSAVAYARAIFSGKVVTITPGFIDGLPASLLEVRVADRVKGRDVYASSASIYVAYPAARFAAGGKQYCIRPRFNSHMPQIGDDVLVFALRGPADEQRQIARVESRDLLFATGSGLRAPHIYQNDLKAVRTLPEAIALVERRLNERDAHRKAR
jgi:hypothetical protein